MFCSAAKLAPKLTRRLVGQAFKLIEKEVDGSVVPIQPPGENKLHWNIVMENLILR